MANSRGRAPGHEFAATGRDGSLEGRTDLVAPKLVASLNATLFVLEGFRSGARTNGTVVLAASKIAWHLSSRLVS